MTQQISPFSEVKWGWDLGESGWNVGMDENLLKFSFFLDGNIDSVVSTLPVLSNGKAYYLTTDKRLYYVVNGTAYSSPTPKWYVLKVRDTGAWMQFDGTNLVTISNPSQLQGSINTLNTSVSSINTAIGTLGTAAYQPTSAFATPASVTAAQTASQAYTDTLRTNLASTTGASLVKFKNISLYDRANKFGTSPFDFGAVGDFTTDDTAAVNSAIADAIARKVPLFINGNFAVTSVEIANANGLSVVASGVLQGSTSATAAAVLIIRNCTDVSVTGRLVVSAAYNTGYTSGVKVWADASGTTSLIDLQNISVNGAQVAWQIGDSAQPDRLLSEITITGGHMYGCPSGVNVIGTQAVVSFIGCNLITNTSGGNASWATLNRIGMRILGATVSVIGGELLMADVSTGLLISVEPITSATYSNPYGVFFANGVCVESASQFVQARNPNSIATPLAGSGQISFDNCSGFHSQNIAPLIYTVADFTGRVDIGTNSFFSSVSRTQPNVQCLSTTTEVTVNRHSFGRNFIQNLSGVVGGTLRFDRRMVCYATNLNGQSLPNATSTTLIFTTNTSTGDLGRFSTSYSTSTGIFTVPAGGLKDVEIKVQFTAGNFTAGEAYIQIDGTTIGLTKANTYQNFSMMIPSLNAGQTIKAVCNNTASGAITAGSGNTGFMTITASC